MDPGPIMDLATGYWASKCFLTANGLPYVDLAPAFAAHAAASGPTLFFRHDPHWTVEGNALAAATFEAWFRENCGSLALPATLCRTQSARAR